MGARSRVGDVKGGKPYPFARAGRATRTAETVLES